MLPLPVGEGWGEGSKREKLKFRFINHIAHPHPVPPPLRASPCGGGGILGLFLFYSTIYFGVCLVILSMAGQNHLTPR